ncbi:sigma-54-dependent transcriptional regulator [Brevibacillus sp. B_LB10_24]|uniref:sigma-54-dependent transcriptional regulator n=1 Tax=Brevibacillus sp. B_LB10_24 TaxID=3380645 RepID=UPI0038B7E407
MRSIAVLIVDDEEQICRIMARKLNKAGFRTLQALDGKTALQVMEQEEIDVVFLDYMLPDMTGIDVLQAIRQDNREVVVYMLTAYGNIENAVKAMKLGANDYLNKPVELNLVKEMVEKAAETKRLKYENQLLKEELKQAQPPGSFLYHGEKMNKVMCFLEKIKETDASILILGESGVGKTALAKWIHENSNRREFPFISVSCAAIPEQLLESELFGYRKGAFTGATETRPGKFEMADGGTIFLDEIGEMSLSMQAKLLHVIEEKRFMKLGSDSYRSVDVRIIAATNKQLPEMVRSGLFREDLYYRLNLAEVELPPLRERPEEIPALACHFISQLNKKYKKQLTLAPEAIEAMKREKWPGNIRQLLNLLERHHILKNGGQITAEELFPAAPPPPSLSLGVSAGEKTAAAVEYEEGSLPAVLEQVEKEMVRKALAKTGGNQLRAASLLGISRHALIYKLKRWKASGSERQG